MRLTSCRTKNEFKEWLAIKIAWMLPRQVALWAMIRVAAHATTGRWGNDHIDQLGYKEFHDRWEQQ
ncbi:MAG TPA: hypothetical protein VLG09_03845 [Candidatus Saccharimonadales bacterium]|nr:hypothetical protein [Candidatus Saccharimonadales bacterium]